MTAEVLMFAVLVGIMDHNHLLSFYRSGKSTHISMISNSVTHLRSYTNTAIAENSAPISQEYRRYSNRRRFRIERRRFRIERRRLRIERRRLRIERRRLRIERRHRRIEWRVLHDVSQCFKCFMMF